MRTLTCWLVLSAFVLSGAQIAAGAAPVQKPSPKATATPNPTVAALSKLSGRQFDIAALRDLLPRFEEDMEIAYAATLNADHPPLLQWNQKMIDRKSRQTKQMLAMLAEMQAPAHRRGVGVVTPEVKQMRQLKSAPLERRYLMLMVERFEHNMAVAHLAIQKGSRDDLKALSGEIARIERQETLMLKNWFKEWYGR